MYMSFWRVPKCYERVNEHIVESTCILINIHARAHAHNV